MSQVCQKCGKDYEPKRRGGKFCSTSCRVTRHQLTRRGRPQVIPYSGDELYLANKLQTVERTAQEVLRTVQGLPSEQAHAELRRLVESWSRVADNSVIERTLHSQRREMETDYEAYRQRTGLF